MNRTHRNLRDIHMTNQTALFIAGMVFALTVGLTPLWVAMLRVL